MRIDYDPEADAIYIELQLGEVDHAREMASNIYVDVDKEGTPLGIEILSVSHFWAKKEAFNVMLDVDKTKKSPILYSLEGV